jgi:hypothetical protein
MEDAVERLSPIRREMRQIVRAFTRNRPGLARVTTSVAPTGALRFICPSSDGASALSRDDNTKRTLD